MHDLCGIVAVSQYLQNTQILLTTLSHYCMLDGAFLKKIETATIFSYGWTITDQYLLHFNCILPIITLFLFKSIGSWKFFVLKKNRFCSILFCKFVPSSNMVHLYEI